MNHQENMRRHFQRFHDGGARRIIGWTFIGLVLATFFALVFGLAVKALWNSIMPAVFGLAMITYWQAFGIIILSKILFSGVHPHRDHDRRGPFPFHKHSTYDRWWQEEGKSAFAGWLEGRAGAHPSGNDAQK
jgi:hypothetical protein